MSAVRLGGSAVLLSHHVDGLELTCDVQQLPGLLLRDSADPLDRSLGAVQELARAQRPQCAVETDWAWGDADEPVILHPSAGRRGSRYCIETSDWMAFIAAVGAVVPRITIQCRAEYLLRVGAVDAFDAVKEWAEDNLIPLVEGRPDEDVERWRIARLDLAADIMGVSLTPGRLRHFTSRATERKAHHGTRATEAASNAVTHFSDGRLTGLTFGRRGAGVYARLYDKTLEADPDALIRRHWETSYGKPLSEDAKVWRVEFELRPEYLRQLADEDGHITTDPRELLTGRLDDVWHHLSTTWLVLRDRRSATRACRCDPQPWWAAMSSAGGLSVVGDERRKLVRKRRGGIDADRLLPQLAGLLAAFGARRRDQTLEGCLGALEAYMRKDNGETRFAAAVERAVLRMPLAARSRADAAANVGDGPALPPLPPAAERKGWLAPWRALGDPGA